MLDPTFGGLPDVAVKARRSGRGYKAMASWLARFLSGMRFFRSCENQAGPNVRSKSSIRRQGTPGDVKRLWTASQTGQPASPVEAGKNPRSSGRGVSDFRNSADFAGYCVRARTTLHANHAPGAHTFADRVRVENEYFHEFSS